MHPGLHDICVLDCTARNNTNSVVMINQIVFTVIAPRVPNSVVTFAYTLEGALVQIGFNADATPAFKLNSKLEAPLQITYEKGKIPAEFAGMIAANCLVKDISEFDFSYENFSSLYAYKVGDLKKQKKLLAALNFEETILAFAFIPRYKAYLNRTGVAQLYPERYLLQRRWENTLPQ